MKATRRTLTDEAEEMKRQCLDLKKQIYNRWEENILTKNFFSPKPQTSSQYNNHSDSNNKSKHNSDDNDEDDVNVNYKVPFASDVTSKVIDEADSDGSVEDDGTANDLEQDSVMSQSQMFSVIKTVDNNTAALVNAINDEDEGLSDSSSNKNMPRILPSKSISKNAVPPRYAPVKLEESIEPVPQNPSLALKILPASPEKHYDNSSGETNSNDADAGAGKEKITPTKENSKNVKNVKNDPPIASRTVSPPLPLYNFKSPVHKPLNSNNNRNGGGAPTTDNTSNNSGKSMKTKAWEWRENQRQNLA